MVRISAFLVSFFMVLNIAFSQEAIGIHEIKKGTEPNEYLIKTTISGLKGVDIARATYKIDDVHRYKKVAKNELFSSRNKDYIKFYVMGVPESGVITIELGLILSDNEAYAFPVEFQYSRNDEKKVVQFLDLVFTRVELIALEGGKGDSKPANGKPKTESENVMATTNNSNMEESSLASPTTTNGSVASTNKTTKKEVIVLEATVEITRESIVENKPTIKEELADTKVIYTIQLLSLSNFSRARFDDYCEGHSLLDEEVSTRIVNGVTKVIYGKANSLDEAKKLIDKLKLLNNIDGAFAVPL